MSMTTAIIIAWALVVLLPFTVAVPMMFRARTAIRIADGRFLLAFSGLSAAVAADFGFENDVYAWFKAGEAPVLSRAELRKAGVPPSLMHLVK